MSVLMKDECGFIVSHQQSIEKGVRDVIPLKPLSCKGEKDNNYQTLSYRCLRKQFAIHSPFQMDSCFNASREKASCDSGSLSCDKMKDDLEKDDTMQQSVKKRKRKVVSRRF